MTLLSDFGTVDPYVGIMKGVILGICPTASVIDLTHAVPPQDVAAGAFLLAQSVKWMPRGAVHVAVVDPGVGGARRAIAVATDQGLFVGPDNGVLSLALGRVRAAVALDNVKYLLPERSSTFHGRDVFAPAAAHLACGVPIDELGPRVRGLVKLKSRSPRRNGARLAGEVVHVDRFGNLITNFSREDLGARFEIVAGDFRARRLAKTYSEAAAGEAVALVGSFGLVEIAVRDGSAAELLRLARGSRVEVRR